MEASWRRPRALAFALILGAAAFALALASPNTDSSIIEYLEPPTVNLTVSSAQAITGNKFICQCCATGSPKPTIAWRRNGMKISGSSEQDLDNGILIIHKLSLNHSGIYQCLVKNKVGNVTANLNIDVRSIPEGDREQKDNVSSDVLTNATISCNMSGHPNSGHTWSRKDGKLLSGSLSAESSCPMYLAEKPVLATGNSEETATKGKRKELACLVTKGNPPPSVTWYKDGELLLEGDLLLLGASVLPNRSILIDYVKHDNEGTYECEVTNIGGKTSRRVNLLVQDAPYFIDDIETVIKARLIFPVNLSCMAGGNPVPKIKWMKNGTPLTSYFVPGYPVRSILDIPKVEKETNGTYECIASNSAGESKKSFDLLVQYPPKILPQGAIKVEGGKEVILECKVEANPIAEVRWRRNGEPLHSQNINYSENHSSIRFVADLSTIGFYECIAVNEGVTRNWIVMIATVPPSFANEREVIVVSAGESTTLSCDSGAYPPLTNYFWTKFHPSGGEDTTFPPVPLTQRDLVLSRINASHQGLYVCHVDNIVGRAQKYFVVLFYDAPHITTYIRKSKEMEKGSELRQICNASGTPKPEVSWLRNGNSTEYDKGNGLLLIENVTSNNTGVYTCVAKNYEATDDRNMEVTVKEPPAMELGYASTVEARVGERLTLYCPLTGGIPPPQLKWFKDGKNISSTSRIHSKTSKKSLTIRNVTLTDRGRYTCQAHNSLGMEYADISVVVLLEPTFIHKSYVEKIFKIVGNTIQLDCSSTGEPRPKVLWFKNSNPVTPFLMPHATFEDQKLKINKSKGTDTGKYYCSVENSAGKITRSFEVDLFGGSPGAWGSWSSWSDCSASCGNSARFRTRSCEAPVGGEPMCPGTGEEWNTCVVPKCKVDGEWSGWGAWSKCSTTCGSGEETRDRRCDLPPPQNGGAACPGPSRQTRMCYRRPCPVHGAWSEWSKWQLCKKCSGGETRRTRNCTSPVPAFGGKPCEGSRVDVKPCSQEGCPVNGRWGPWTEWSPCSATCGHSSQTRERFCNNPAPSNNGSFCIGRNRKIQPCATTPCDNIPLLTSIVVGGTLNGFNIAKFSLEANVTDMSDKRYTQCATKDPFLLSGLRGWFPYLSFVLSPSVWLTAFQKGKGINGYSLTEGRFKMRTLVSFKTEKKENVTIIHEGLGVKDKRINLQVDIQGSVPLLNKRRRVILHPYQEVYISTGPGELFASSKSSAQMYRSDKKYTWITTRTITYDAKLKKLEHPVQSLTVETYKSSKTRFEASAFISDTKTMCPEGFKLSNTGYCEDIDECSNRTLQNCHFSQTCTNTLGSYECSCPPGFKASWKGECLDVDECEDMLICSHKCVNLQGNFKCLCPPGTVFDSSKTECSNVSGLTHCSDNQTEIDGVCYDADPCASPSNPCKENNTICLHTGERFKCISISCPSDYSRVKDSKSCVKYCNTTPCNSSATISETIIKTILSLREPIAPFEVITQLSLNVEKSLLLHTFYRITKNEAGKPFRVRVLNGQGIVYSVSKLKPGQEYSVTFVATTYDDTHSKILYFNKFEVILHIAY